MSKIIAFLKLSSMLTPDKITQLCSSMCCNAGLPNKKQRIPEIVFDVDTQQNHTTLQLYLFQRWARKMYVVPGVLWVHTSSEELLILSACHWAGLVGDQPPQRGPPCHRGRQTSHLIYTFAGRQGEGHTTKHQRAGGLEELGTIVLWWSLD